MVGYMVLIKSDGRYLSDYAGGERVIMDTQAVEYLLSLPEHELVKLLTSKALYSALHSQIKDAFDYFLLESCLDRYEMIVVPYLSKRMELGI